MKKKIWCRVVKIIKYMFCFQFMMLIAIIIWIDWKRNYDGLPIETWGMPHRHE